VPLLRWVRDYFSLGEFRLPTGGVPANCRVRLFTAADTERCDELYRLNEGTHFPMGVLAEFRTWLHERHALVVVIEQDGIVRAVGGLNAHALDDRQIVSLTFGMVDPAHHGRGFGTTLLCARLALLHAGAHPVLAFLSTAGLPERAGGSWRISSAGKYWFPAKPFSSAPSCSPSAG
jgi:GNAT superfamily N-acetyltransferase